MLTQFNRRQTFQRLVAINRLTGVLKRDSRCHVVYLYYLICCACSDLVWYGISGVTSFYSVLSPVFVSVNVACFLFAHVKSVCHMYFFC